MFILSKWARMLRCSAAIGIGVVVMSGCSLSDSEQAEPGHPVTLTAHTADGSAPSAEIVALSRKIILERAERLQFAGTEVVVEEGDRLVVTIPGDDGTRARELGRTGRLHIRPVLTATPATSSGPAGDNATHTGARRQSTDPAVQLRAMTELTCAASDPLENRDDPALPLVTCDPERDEVLLLGPAALGGTDVVGAEAGSRAGIHTVKVTFRPDRTEALHRFTTDQIGLRSAFVVDSRVVVAPVGQEPLTGGQLEISGTFSAQSAYELAVLLDSGGLPIAWTAS
ncbi:SecDF P1 head subdomain-containing protein [Nocardia sp. NPDC003963]